jgi:hypothetical protein
MLKLHLVALLALLTARNLQAQSPHAPFEIITEAFCKSYDLSNLLVTQPETGTVGVFDTGYWRLLVHFETIARDEQDPAVYHIKGAYRTKQRVTPVDGEIRIMRVKQYDRAFFWVIDTTFELPPDAPAFDEKDFKYTFCTASFELREDKSQPDAGVLTGKLDFGIHEDSEGALLDDLQNYQPDAFSNFIYKGEWKPYGAGSPKPCVWGEGRIPLPPGVDVGMDEFQISRRYKRNGWQTDRAGRLLDNPSQWWR